MALKKAKLVNRIDLTHDVIELKFICEEGAKYQAGQFINIKIADNAEKFPCFRAYSLCCSQTEGEKHLSICVKVIEGGRGSNWLNSLKKENEIEFLGPTGKFVFENEEDRGAFFIATGTGVAPLKAMIEDQLTNGNKSPIQLLFGVRNEDDIFYLNEFEKLSQKNQNFKFNITLSKGEDTDGMLSGRVTNHLEEWNLDNKNTKYYICGLSPMINDANKILLEKGVPEELIHFEKYD